MLSTSTTLVAHTIYLYHELFLLNTSFHILAGSMPVLPDSTSIQLQTILFYTMS